MEVLRLNVSTSLLPHSASVSTGPFGRDRGTGTENLKKGIFWELGSGGGDGPGATVLALMCVQALRTVRADFLFVSLEGAIDRRRGGTVREAAFAATAKCRARSSQEVWARDGTC